MRCTITSNLDAPFVIAEVEIERGMSGSPLVSSDGAAIGVITAVSEGNPRLAVNLPGWLLRQLALAQVVRETSR